MIEAIRCRLCEAAPTSSSLSYGSAQIWGNWIARVYITCYELQFPKVCSEHLVRLGSSNTKNY